MSGHFRPGDKLTLRALASSLGVSLTPAREALFNLTAEGVLEMRPNGSVYIPVMDRADFIELIKTRSALEGLIAAEATPRLTAAAIDHIANANDAVIAANDAGDYKQLVEKNWEFHFSIYEAANMPFLLKLIEGCWLRSGSYVSLIYPEFARTDQGIQNHNAILRHLRTGDAEGVAKGVRDDISFSGEALLAAVAG